MKNWRASRFDLSPEQKKVVRIPPRQSALILGPPGSGKTHVLVQRAAYFLQSLKISAQSVRLFVSSDVMENFIKLKMKSLGYPGEIVTTFDKWCHSFYEDNISHDLPRVYIDGCIDFKKMHRAVFNALQKRKNSKKILEFVLVDDGQDMTLEAFAILKMFAKHITVFADPQHKLSEEGVSESQIMETLKLNGEKCILQGDFRSSRPVADLASFFIEDERFRNSYISEYRFNKSKSEGFLCYIAPSEEEELNHLSHCVRQRLVMKDKAGILVPTNRLVHRVAKALEGRGIETEKAIPLFAQNVIQGPYDFDNGLPKITTYNMARGLTFDSVLLPQLTEPVFSEIPSHLRKKFLFMGIVRASNWIYLSTIKGQEFKEMETLKSAGKAGHVWIFD